MRYLLILSLLFISCSEAEKEETIEPVTVKEYLQSNIFYYQDTYTGSEGNSLKADWFFDYVISGDNFYIHHSYNDINDIIYSDCYFDGTIIYKNVGWSEYIFKVSSQETWNSYKQRVPNKC